MPSILTRRLSIARSLCAARATNGKKSVVFLGTPVVAADVLEKLLEESCRPSAPFQITTVVSQPNKPVGRKNRRFPTPTPVSAAALRHGYVPENTLLTPHNAKDEAFLTQLEAVAPDLCITAAYGNFLPHRFLQIPRYGTLNIHPSLLPKYRGAAPVNRALQDGVTQTGVSIAYTVDAMDAGPILTSRAVDVDPDIQAPAMLTALFSIGTALLIEALPSVFNGSAVYTPQDPTEVSYAPKMRPEESLLRFDASATELHNRVRAFTPWPGTRAVFKLFNTLKSAFTDLELRILETRVPAPSELRHVDFRQGMCFVNNQRLLVQCGDGSVLELLSVQKPGGKRLGIRDFKNGLPRQTMLTLN